MGVETGVVAFLLTDIEGSTRLWQAHRAEMPEIVGRHDALLTAAIAANAGRVLTERGEGDSFFAVFSRASDAVAAARDIQRAIQAESWPEGVSLRVRIAINTGEAGGDYRGMAANRSARIRALARGGQVLISQTTHGLVEDAGVDGVDYLFVGEVRLRDIDRPEHVYEARVAGLSAPAAVGAFDSLRARPRRAALFGAASLAAVVAGVLVTTSVLGARSHPPTQSAPPTTVAKHYRIVTVAGNGTQGFVDSPSAPLDAELDKPQGIAVDSRGDVFIADTGNSMIRELAAGQLTTVVGGGNQTQVAGQFGPDLELDHPTGLFADPATGDLYIADTGGSRVLKLGADGHVELVEGPGTPGYKPGGAPTAVTYGVLSSDSGAISTSPELEVLFADRGQGVVRYKDGATGALRDLPLNYFASPVLAIQKAGLPSLALGASGRYYLSDSGGNHVYEASPGCVGVPCKWSPLAGTGAAGESGDGGPAYSAKLDSPEGLAVDSNSDVFVCDTGNSVLRAIDGNTGRIAIVAGKPGAAGAGGDGGAAQQAELRDPAAVAVGPNGTIFIADTGNNRIRELLPAG